MNLEECPWTWKTMSGDHVQIGDRVWSNGKYDEQYFECAYVGTVIGWDWSDDGYDEEEGNVLYVQRDDKRFTAQNVEWRYGFPEPKKVLEEHELTQLKDIWAVHSKCIRGVLELDKVLAKDPNDAFLRPGDRVIPRPESDTGWEDGEGTIIDSTTSHGTLNLHVARDDRVDGGGMGDSWLMHPGDVLQIKGQQTVEARDNVKKLEKMLGDSPLARRLEEFNDEKLAWTHKLIDEGVAAVSKHMEEAHDFPKYEEEQLEAMTRTLKQMVPFHNPAELWVILNVIYGLLMFNHHMKTDHDGEFLSEGEASEMLGELLSIDHSVEGHKHIDASDKEEMSSRLKKSKPMGIPDEDEADSIIERFGLSSN